MLFRSHRYFSVDNPDLGVGYGLSDGTGFYPIETIEGDERGRFSKAVSLYELESQRPEIPLDLRTHRRAAGEIGMNGSAEGVLDFLEQEPAEGEAADSTGSDEEDPGDRIRSNLRHQRGMEGLVEPWNPEEHGDPVFLECCQNIIGIQASGEHDGCPHVERTGHGALKRKNVMERQ